MTHRKDLKQVIRERMKKTGESFTTARRHVLAARTPEPVFGNNLFPYLRDAHTTLVPRDAAEYGPFARVWIVPDSEVEAALAAGSWRAVTEAEAKYAFDCEFSAFEDYGNDEGFS